MLTLVLTLVCTAQRDRFPQLPQPCSGQHFPREKSFSGFGWVREDSEGNQHLTLGWAGGVGAMDARAAGDDAGGVSGEIEALRRSAMASSDDGRLEALSNLGHRLAWLCRIKYLDWWSPAGPRAEDAGRNRNASTSSDVDTGEQRARSPPRQTPPSLTSPLLSLSLSQYIISCSGSSRRRGRALRTENPRRGGPARAPRLPR